jgi:hypothetical protein
MFLGPIADSDQLLFGGAFWQIPIRTLDPPSLKSTTWVHPFPLGQSADELQNTKHVAEPLGLPDLPPTG